MAKDIEEFWEEQLNKTVVIRFRVTDKELAKKAITLHLTDHELPKPSLGSPESGLEPLGFITKDTTMLAKDFIGEFLQLVSRYKFKL